MRFKVLAGKHTCKEHQGVKDGDGRPLKTMKVYRAGEVIDTDTDLAAKFNHPPGAVKFERLVEDAPRPQPVHNAPAPSPAHATTPQQPQPAPQQVAQPQPARAAKGPDKYDSMSVKELTDFAAECEVDLRGATRKEEIVKILRAS